MQASNLYRHLGENMFLRSLTLQIILKLKKWFYSWKKQWYSTPLEANRTSNQLFKKKSFFSPCNNTIHCGYLLNTYTMVQQKSDGSYRWQKVLRRRTLIPRRPLKCWCHQSSQWYSTMVRQTSVQNYWLYTNYLSRTELPANLQYLSRHDIPTVEPKY